MPFFDLAQRTAKTLRDGVDLRTYWGEKMLFSHATLKPNAVVPLHSHPHEQGGVVIEGELTLTIEGEGTRILRAGDMYVALGNVPHMAVAGPNGCIAIDIFAPVREEYQFPNA